MEIKTFKELKRMGGNKDIKLSPISMVGLTESEFEEAMYRDDINTPLDFVTLLAKEKKLTEFQIGILLCSVCDSNNIAKERLANKTDVMFR